MRYLPDVALALVAVGATWKTASFYAPGMLSREVAANVFGSASSFEEMLVALLIAVLSIAVVIERWFQRQDQQPRHGRHHARM